MISFYLQDQDCTLPANLVAWVRLFESERFATRPYVLVWRGMIDGEKLSGEIFIQEIAMWQDGV